MQKYLLISLTLLLVFFIAPSLIKAQVMPVDTVESLAGIEIRTSVDLAEIYIGDLITYKLTIIYDSMLELTPPPFGANLGAFDVRDYQSDIVTKLDDGRIQSENIFVISTFTTGEYIIPPIPIIFSLPDSTYKAVLSESVTIKVLSLVFDTDDSTDIKPLKGQYEFVPDRTVLYLWGGIILIMLVNLWLFIWWLKLKTKNKSIFIDPRKPWEIAFEELALLKQKGLVENKLYKDYYIGLTDIYRNYFQRIYFRNFIDMTTEEFMTSFEKLETPHGMTERSKNLLTHADLVKFAKMIPELKRIESDYNEVHNIIEEIRVDIKRKQDMTVITNIPDQPQSPSPVAANSLDDMNNGEKL